MVNDTKTVQLRSPLLTEFKIIFYGVYIMTTHVRGFFDTDLHEVSWHFATHEAVRPSGFEVQLTE